MMKKRLLALLLALGLILSLCACGDSAADSSADPSGDVSDPSAEPTIEVDLTQDTITFSAGLSAEDVLLTVNGENISADVFLYLLFMNCYYYESYYYYFGGTVDAVADNLLEDTVNAATYYAVLRQKAAELGCVLTDEQLAEVEAGKTGENQESYEQSKAIFGLTDDGMEFLTTLDYYRQNLLDTIPEPTEDELNGYVYQTKHILLMTVDTSGTPELNDDGQYVYPSLDEDKVAAQRALAEDILTQLRAVEGDEQLALFDELMEQYSEDGRDEDGHIDAAGYEVVLGDMVKGYEEGALALGFGEISDIVESTYGYHIILRQEVEFREATADEYAEEYRAYLLDEKMDQWVEGVEPVRADALTKLDVADFYERYFAYYDAFVAQLAEES